MLLSPLMAVLATAAFAQTPPTFTDVDPGNPYAVAIGYLKEHGIVGGYADGMFKPGSSINRAEFTSIIVNALDPSAEAKDTALVCAQSQRDPFADVQPSHWFAPSACVARQSGIISGYSDNTFRPGNTITFVEAASILGRAFRFPADPSATPWYRPSVESLLRLHAVPVGIARFDQTLTRGDMAEMLYRLIADDGTKPSPAYADLERQSAAPVHAAPAAKVSASAKQAPSAPLPTVPGAGYSQVSVTIPQGTFKVDVIKADLADGTQVITDSGNPADCANECTVMSVADFVQRNGGYAGINGTYFCPPEYKGECDGKHNYFYWFLYNHTSNQLINNSSRDWDRNSGLFVFRPGSIQFIRDTRNFQLDSSVTGAVSMWPVLVQSGQYALDPGVLDDKQKVERANKGILGHIGNTVYLMVAHGVTMDGSAAVAAKLGMEDAINLDSAGSIGLYWKGQYKMGPGRPIPNAIILKKP